MHSAPSCPSLLLCATAFLVALGSAAVVRASPSIVDDITAAAAAAGAPAAGLLRFSPNINKQLNLVERGAGRSDPDRPDLAAANVLKPRAATNLQFFQGALSNIAAPPISQSNDATRPFSVDGDTFVSVSGDCHIVGPLSSRSPSWLSNPFSSCLLQTDFQSAVDRSCDNQHNSCANAANSQKSSSFSVGDCDTQDTKCKAAASSATQTAFTKLTSSSDEFDFYCDV
ncbi:uncharacterized protein SPSK_03584 [Sporothrix schenckii 1099-18]|uniref:Ig-like domain-containing protein n=1 Tax=Sporothrix schenckii 1099-18 TaxID=1397361 RepID=A0A0F2M0S2_SPOSC|nr:uncharacterized protein SPSK_03584 [Sporothrix schenckii 1099-18]KJR82674.1 hypothetical protein SPSK_03584 [Sporothrix schenckii 1099-18]